MSQSQNTGPRAELGTNGSSHASVTPLHPARLREEISQFRRTLSVVAFSALCLMRDATTSSTTSCGRPGGSSPSR